MAFHTKKQFCALCEIKTRELSVYVKRGKVILSGDLVDDTIEINQQFIYSRSKKSGSKTPDPVVADPKNPGLTVIHSVENKKQILKPTTPEDLEKKLNWQQLDLEKKKLDIEKTTEEIEILKVKKDKLHGAVIPTEVVKMLFAQQFKSVTAAFHLGADNYLMELAKLKGLNREEVATLRGKLIEIINVAISDSVTESKKMIVNIISEYSERKEVGEKA